MTEPVNTTNGATQTAQPLDLDALRCEALNAQGLLQLLTDLVAQRGIGGPNASGSVDGTQQALALLDALKGKVDGILRLGDDAHDASLADFRRGAA